MRTCGCGVYVCVSARGRGRKSEGYECVKDACHETTIHVHLPALVRVLYTGQTYMPVSGCFLSAVGISHITGMSVNSSFGRDSASSNVSTSHLAPSKNSPLM